MKNGMQKRSKRSYRLLALATFLVIVASVLFGVLVSEDAALVALLCGATLITLGAIFFAGVGYAEEVRHEREDTGEFGGISPKMPKRT